MISKGIIFLKPIHTFHTEMKSQFFNLILKPSRLESRVNPICVVNKGNAWPWHNNCCNTIFRNHKKATKITYDFLRYKEPSQGRGKSHLTGERKLEAPLKHPKKAPIRGKNSLKSWDLQGANPRVAHLENAWFSFKNYFKVFKARPRIQISQPLFR